MSKAIHISGAVGLLLVILVCEGHAQPTAQIPANAATNVVKLKLIVTDAHNHALDELKKEELKIFEHDRERSVVNVEKDERPVDYGLVIDSSGSFRSTLSAVLPGAAQIIKGNRSEDRTFIERFVTSEKIILVQGLTSDPSQLMAALDRFIIEGGRTAVLDAIYAGADYLTKQTASEPQHRKALVLITDGEDRESLYGIDSVLNLLQQSGIQVFTIGVTTELDSDAGFILKRARDKAEGLLKRIANKTGGRLFLLRDRKTLAEDLDNAVKEIIHDLHKQFLVTYQSETSANNSFREIKVKMFDKKLTAIASPGYVVAGSTSPSQ